MKSSVSIFVVAIGCLCFILSACEEHSSSAQYEVMSGGTDQFQQFIVIVSPETTDEQCQEVADEVFRARLRGDARGTVAVFDDEEAARIFNITEVPDPTDQQLARMESHLRCQVTRNPAGNVRRSWQ